MTVRVTIDSNGLITIPEQIRAACGLQTDGELILETVEQGLLLRPSPSFTVEDYTDERIAEFASEELTLGRMIQSG
jgi:AbrB family looped-hinge helix DNA binding protein